MKAAASRSWPRPANHRTPDNLIITNGSFHAIELIAQAFIDPGDIILIEAPTWSGAVMIYQRAGATPVTVPTDADGLDLDALERTLGRALIAAGTRPKFLYTMPTFHNPLGVTMPLARRRAPGRAIAAAHGLPLIEDDAYFDLRFSGEHLPTLYSLDRAGLVIYLSTFSKILAAGMRLGWAVAAAARVGEAGAAQERHRQQPLQPAHRRGVHGYRRAARSTSTR